jgi:hypothetical protein
MNPKCLGYMTRFGGQIWSPRHARISKNINGTGAVCDQKTSKFFVSSGEESIAGHMGVNEVY